MIRTPAGWWGDYSDDEAADFPGMNIALAHTGQDHCPRRLAWQGPGPNVYLELST